jgi:hypothetical protein
MAQILAKHPLNSTSHLNHYPRSQTTLTSLALRETLKDPLTSNIFTGPLTECTSQQQQHLGGLQINPPIGRVTSGKPSTMEDLPISPPALESSFNGRSIMSVPSRGHYLTENSTKRPLMAEDLTIPVNEGIFK